MKPRKNRIPGFNSNSKKPVDKNKKKCKTISKFGYN